MIKNESLDKLIEFVKNLEETEVEDLEEALEELKQVNKKKENPFDVGMKDEAYYGRGFEAIGVSERWDAFDLRTFVPCKDKSIVEERQKRGYLNALLEKFAYENNANVTDKIWKDNSVYKYYVIYDYCLDIYKVEGIVGEKNINTIYFDSEQICQRAINEIVLPFMEGGNE